MAKYPVMPHFATPKVDNTPPVPQTTQAHFITGDPVGLHQLATAMYGFVSGSSAKTVQTLVDGVVRVVQDDKEEGGYTPDPDGGWVGDTAHVFRDTFIGDAAMMNGLNVVMCTVAKTVNDLACGLASLERQLETDLIDGLSAMCKGFNLDWIVAGGRGTSPNFSLTPLGSAEVAKTALDAGDIAQAGNRIGDAYFTQAEKLRHTAASQLAAVGKILEDAFNYYAAYSAGAGSPTTMDPSVLLTSGQSASDSVAVGDLKGEYAKLVKQLNGSSLDQNAVKKVLLGMGITSASSGKILNGIKDVKDAKGVLGTGGKFASFVGEAVPILLLIGMTI